MSSQVVLSKDSNEIRVSGGFLFLTPYDATKNIDDNMASFVAEKVEIGISEIVLASALKFPSTGGTVIIDPDNDNSETVTYTSITNNTLSLESPTTKEHALDAVALYVGANGYDEMFCAGHSEGTTINLGKEDGEIRRNELGEAVAMNPTFNKPKLTINLMQSGINEIALANGWDIEADLVEGLVVAGVTEQRHYAGIYVAKSKKVNSNEVSYQIWLFPHLYIGASSDINYNTEIKALAISMQCLVGSPENYDVKLMQLPKM